jgi:hypothetical protein
LLFARAGKSSIYLPLQKAIVFIKKKELYLKPPETWLVNSLK